VGGPNTNANLQQLTYALMVFHRFPDAKSVTMHLQSPRRDEVSKATITRGEVDAAFAEIKAVISKSLDANAEPVPNNHCQWCVNMTTCPAYVEPALTLAKAQGFELSASADPATMSAETLDNGGLQVATMMDAWSKKVKSKANEIHKGGDYEFQNCKERKRTTTKFESVEDALVAFLDVLPTEAVAAGITSISDSKIEKYLEERGDTEALKEFEDARARLARISQTATWLVPRSNPAKLINKDRES
jgi:hypothetical protein